MPAGTNNPRDHQHYRVFQPVGEVSSNSSFSWRAEVAVEIEPVTRGGGGAPLYTPFRFVPLHRVGFLRPFGLKTGVHFDHFGLESGWVFEGTTGVYEQFYRVNSK